MLKRIMNPSATCGWITNAELFCHAILLFPTTIIRWNAWEREPMTRGMLHGALYTVSSVLDLSQRWYYLGQLLSNLVQSCNQ
jgi:hypothetical protein